MHSRLPGGAVAAVIALVAAGVGCKGGAEDTAPAETSSPTTTPDAIALDAFQGVDGTLLWLDRALSPTESLQRDDAGTWTDLDATSEEFVDPSAGATYRVVAADGSVIAEASADTLSATATSSAPILAPFGAPAAVQVTLSELPAGAPLGDLQIATYADGESRWLDVTCADGGCWVEGESAWSDVSGDLPASLDLTVPAWHTAPSATAVVTTVRSVTHDFALASASVTVAELGRSLAWGDLHSHTNLSHDGCENPDNPNCPAIGSSPGESEFLRADENGLDFVAITDHAEWDVYHNDATGQVIDIWAEQKALAAAADGGPVVPLIGYEWTSAYSDGPNGEVGGHRTVVLEDIDACAAWRVPAVELVVRKPAGAPEVYEPTSAPYRPLPTDLEAALAEAAAQPGCEPTRAVSYFHHPAYDPPAWVDWTSELNREADNYLVEVYSEHGSSECADRTAEGCDWYINDAELGMQPYYRPDGSVQTALAEGYRVGFTGGTDNHEANPGGGIVAHEPGHTATVFGSQIAFSPGSVTGVLYDGDVLGRPEIIDALLSRSTLASTWLFDDVRVAALGADGVVYLPGQEVPAAASPLTLTVVVGDAADSVRVQLLDAQNTAWVDEEAAAVAATFDLGPDEARYVRIRVWIGDIEHRVWASPFFGAP